MATLRQQFVDDLKKARMQTDILYAYRKITKKEPYVYQGEFLTSIERLNAVLKSRQTGFTYAAAFKKFWLTWTGKSENEIYMSVSQRASNTVTRYVKEFARAAGLGPQDAEVWNNEQITWNNGSSLFSLPQASESVRSLHGNVLLDECAHYERGRDILEAVLPFLSRGYGLDAITTPAGMDEVFYKSFWENAHFNKKLIKWSDCPDLTEENLKPIWDTMDEESIRQEYYAEFIDESSSYFPYALLMSCAESDIEGYEGHNVKVNEDGVITFPAIPINAKYLGVDIGRTHDATEFIFLDSDGKMCGRTKMKNVPFRYQVAYARLCLDKVNRACFDATGLGMNMVEDLASEYGSKVVGVVFTQDSKELMMTNLHIAFEKRPDGRRITIHNDRDLINQLHAMKRIPTPNGIRFDVEKNTKHHGDAAWGLALAWHAGFIIRNYEPTTDSLLDYL